jgi:predicted deacylase
VSKIQALLADMAPGTVLQDSLSVGTMSSGMIIAIPVTIIKGVADGPCLWINGQVHGNELNGVIAAVEFGRRVHPSDLRGSIVISPTANPLGLDNRTKTAPQDLQDLDQTFPGNSKGMVTNHLSYVLFEEIKAVANCVVNMHTMGSIHDSKPYCVYKNFIGSAVTEAQLLRMTSFFEPSVSCRMDVGGAGELPGNIAGGLDYQCLAIDIPAFMVELGQGSWYTPENVEQAIRGLYRLALHLGVLSELPSGIEHVANAVRRVTKRQWVMAHHGGLYLTDCRAGQIVPADVALGTIYDLHGHQVETVHLDLDCIVIGMRRDPVVHTGDRVAFVATQWDQVVLTST